MQASKCQVQVAETSFKVSTVLRKHDVPNTESDNVALCLRGGTGGFESTCEETMTPVSFAGGCKQPSRTATHPEPNG